MPKDFTCFSGGLSSDSRGSESKMPASWTGTRSINLHEYILIEQISWTPCEAIKKVSVDEQFLMHAVEGSPTMK